MDIAAALNIRMGGPLTVFKDGIAGDLMFGLRLLVLSQGDVY